MQNTLTDIKDIEAQLKQDFTLASYGECETIEITYDFDLKCYRYDHTRSAVTHFLYRPTLADLLKAVKNADGKEPDLLNMIWYGFTLVQE